MKKTSILIALSIFLVNSDLSTAQIYEYDNLNRLTKVIYEDGYIIEYSYDEYGNTTNIIKKSKVNESKEDNKNPSNNDEENDNKNNYFEERVKFKDVKQNTWYSESVNYVVNKKIMIGTSKDTFSPNSYTTRAMITMILYRLSGDEKPKYNNTFKDVKNDAWYTESINWALQNNIVTGITKDEFKPNDTLTRQQLVTILYNFAKTKTQINETKIDLDKYKDKDKISNYAINAMNWAVKNGILKGTKVDELSPNTGVTRAQMAVIIRRFMEKMKY